MNGSFSLLEGLCFQDLQLISFQKSFYVFEIPSNNLLKHLLVVVYSKPLGFIVTWYLGFYLNCSQ